MKDFLESHAQGGESQGEGSFTLDPDFALEKLAAHVFRSEFEWILQLLRFAVRAGASKIEVKLRVWRFDFFAAMPDQTDFPDVLSFFRRVPSELTDLERPLALAIWQLSLNQGRRFECRMGDCLYECDGQDLSRGEQASDGGFYLTLHHDRGATRGDADQWNATALKLLYKNTGCLSLPLTVDGKNLSFLRASETLGHEPVYLSHGHFTMESPSWELPKSGSFRFLDENGQYLVNRLKLFDETTRTQALWVVYIPLSEAHQTSKFGHSRSESRIFWLLDGIVTEHESLGLGSDAGVSFELYLSAAGLTESFDGRLVHDDALNQRKRAAISGLLSALRNCQVEMKFEPKQHEIITPQSLFAVVISPFTGKKLGAPPSEQEKTRVRSLVKTGMTQLLNILQLFESDADLKYMEELHQD